MQIKVQESGKVVDGFFGVYWHGTAEEFDDITESDISEVSL